MKYFILFILLLLKVNCFTQTIIESKIYDFDTKEPLKYVSIRNLKTKRGTITNNQGYFKLFDGKLSQTDVFEISHLGYQPFYLSYNEIKNKKIIYLKNRDFALDEIIVMPDSTLLDLLKKAYNKIPENYPNEPTSYEGFYREVLSVDKSDTILYYIEGITEIYKDSYKNSQKGEIRLVKSRKFVHPDIIEYNNIQIYGGIYLPLSGDEVKVKSSFINPKYFSYYQYSLVGSTLYNNDTVYIVKVKSKQSSIEYAKLYIDKKSLAYIYFEYQFSEAACRKKNKSVDNKIEVYDSKGKVFYIKNKDKWILNYIEESFKFKNKISNKNILYEKEYLNIALKAKAKPIPIKDQVSRVGVLSEIAQPYHQTDWKETTIVPDSLTNQQIMLKYDNTQSDSILQKDSINVKSETKTKKGVLAINKRIGLIYPFVTLPKQNLNIQINDELFPMKSKYTNVLPLYVLFDFAFKNNWGIQYALSINALNKNQYSSFKIAPYLKYQLRHKTPVLYCNLALNYNRVQQLAYIGKVSSKENIIVNTKNTNQKTMNTYIGNIIHAIEPEITFTKPLKKRDLHLSFSYLIPFVIKNVSYYKKAWHSKSFKEVINSADNRYYSISGEMYKNSFSTSYFLISLLFDF